jgi:hypothetical protein
MREVRGKVERIEKIQKQGTMKTEGSGNQRLSAN